MAGESKMINDLDGLEKRIDLLIKQAESTSETLSKKDAECTALHEELEAKKKELDEIKKRESLVEAKLEKIIKRCGSLESLLDKLKPT